MFDVAWVQQNFPDLTNVSKLGEGGQKLVFQADHSTHGHLVLKLIKLSQDPQRVAREVLAVRQVNSPRVPRVLDGGTIGTPSGDCLWLQEQCIAGDSLRAILSGRVLTLAEVIRLGCHILEALTEVERAHLVHRDIKPDNVICDGSGNFWLIDFGIARHLDLASLTATAAIIGPATVGYAPPEQYMNRKREVDIRTDLFALGVTLCEAATGRHPFCYGARDGAEVVRRIETQPVPAFSIAGDTRNELHDFLLTLMQRRPDHRVPNAADALSWLRAIAARLNIAV